MPPWPAPLILMLDRAAPVLRIGASPPIGEPLPPGARRQLLSDRLCAGTTGADEVPPWSALLLLVLDRAAPMLRIGASPPIGEPLPPDARRQLLVTGWRRAAGLNVYKFIYLFVCFVVR